MINTDENAPPSTLSEKTWKHVSTGGLYRIIGFAIQEADMQPVVIYRNAGGTIWTRPCKEFFDGRFAQEGTHFRKDDGDIRRESQRANIREMTEEQAMKKVGQLHPYRDSALFTETGEGE